MTPPDPRRWRMLPVVLSATFMALFDFNVVNVAAPSLSTGLHASDAALELIVGGYAFSYASGLVTGGRLGDLFGYRRLFLIGMTGFTIASVLCGLAQSPGQLVAARLLQGFTAAAMVPQVLALITSVFPAKERPRAVSWFGVAIGGGAVAGQVLGGLLLDADLFGLGWRVIFLINLPVGLVALPLAARLLPGHRAEARPRLDPLGALGLAATVALALVPLVLGRTLHWPAWGWISLAAALPALAAVLWWQLRLTRRGGHPLLDLSLFRNRYFNAGLVINMTFMAFFTSIMLGITLFLQGGLHLSPLDSGLTFGPLGLVFAVTSIAAQRFTARFGYKVITAGCVVAIAGLLVMLAELQISGTHITALELQPAMILIGIGNGLSFPALIGAVLAGVQGHQAGGAAGVLTTVQQFSSAAGVAVLGTLFFSTLGSRPSIADFVSALELVTGLGGVLILTATGLTVLLRPRTATESVRNSVELADAVA
ncbi:MAG: transporter [Actinomycetia bacterium]|nr:transporter [Actinomycetes bacterium]